MDDRAFDSLTSQLRSVQDVAATGSASAAGEVPGGADRPDPVRGVEPKSAWLLPATGSDHRPVRPGSAGERRAPPGVGISSAYRESHTSGQHPLIDWQSCPTSLPANPHELQPEIGSSDRSAPRASGVLRAPAVGQLSADPAWGRVKPEWRTESLGWFDVERLVGAGLVLHRRYRG